MSKKSISRPAARAAIEAGKTENLYFKDHADGTLYQYKELTPKEAEDLLNDNKTLFYEDAEEQPEQIPEQQPEAFIVKRGRPRKYTADKRSTEKGLPDEYTRATFIIKKATRKAIKALAFYEDIPEKDIVNAALEAYLNGKTIAIRKEDE